MNREVWGVLLGGRWNPDFGLPIEPYRDTSDV